MYNPRSDAALQRALNRYYSASQDKAFQGTIPRYESEASEAAWDAIDWELERARELVEALIQRRVEAATLVLETSKINAPGHFGMEPYEYHATHGMPL